MTSKEIYQSIDQSKISPKGKSFLQKAEKSTNGFTIQNDKLDSVMKKLYSDLKSKKPEALKNVTTKTVVKEVKVPTTKTEQKKEPKKTTKTVKKEVKKASGTKKVTKPTKTPSEPKEGKKEHISTRASKLAKKEGISFKEARAKLSKEAKEQIKKEEKQADKELDKLLKFVRKDVFEDGEKYPKIYGKQDPKKSSLSADAKRMAKPVGKRVSKNGKTYYEYRDNRSDRNSLPAPKGQYKYKGKTPPYLAEGGAIDSLKKDMNSKLDIHSEYYAKGGATSPDTTDVYFFAYEEFMKNGKKFKSEKELYDFVNDGYAFPKYSKKSVKSAFEGLNKEMYAKGGRTISIVNDGVKYDKSKYKAVYGDFDKDGTVNIDDANPLDKTKSGQVEQVELRKTFDKLLGVKAELDEIMYDAVETLDEKAPKGADIYARTKTPYSILKKLVEKRMLDPKRGLTDMIGTTIAVDNQKELEQVRDKIDGGLLGKVLDRDDFYKSPNAGYMAYHYIVEYKGVPVEVQLKTKNMKKLHEVSHEAYKNGTLNAKSLDSLSKTFMRADKGDAKAKAEISRLLKDKKLLASKISKAKMEAGGTLPTPFGQAGLVGETGTLNEVDLFAMGGGLPQGVHQYYANTYNPAYPTPHGYAKGGKVNLEKLSDETYRMGEIDKKHSKRLFEISDDLADLDLGNKTYAKGGKTQKLIDKIAQKEFGKNYSELNDSDKYFVNDAYASIQAEKYSFAKGGKVGNRLGDFRKRLIDLGDEEFVDYKEKQLKNKQELYYAFQDRLRRFHKQTIFVADDLPFEKGGEIDAFIMKFVKDAPASNLRVDSEELTAKLKKGGKLGFDGLAKKVAKRYEGKPVEKEFQNEYGKKYSKDEAMEVGRKVAGKVYRQQQGMAKGGKTKRSKHSFMQDRRRVSSEPWEVAYQKRKKNKMEAGGTLPTPFGQAGLVGETGAMNEMDMFAMGGGLPQGVHQYYANTYNPAYPTPHGYAKGGKIQMSEVYNVNGKDYLFSTPIQNNKGTYTGWDAYEVVYDTFDGEKHLNYTKTKRGKAKYFPNGVKRTEAEDYFAKGGMTTSDKHAKIIADLKKIKSDVTDRPPYVFERDGLLLVSSEYGDEFSDYYGTYYEPMYIDKRLEAIADKYDGYWVWQDAGTIGFVDDLSTISDTIGGGRNFAKGGLTDSKYIPSFEIYEVVTKDGKVYENDYSAMEFLSGAYVSDKVVSKSDEDKSQMSLFKKGGKLPKGAIYIKRRDIDYITIGDEDDRLDEGDKEKVNGKNLFNGFWIDPKKQKTLIAEAKKQGRLGKSKAKVGDKVKLIKGAGSETIFRNFPNGEYEVKKVKKGNKSVPEGFYEIENKDGNKTQLATSRFETKMAKGGRTQGYNDKLDESLGNTKGKRSTKEQNYKDRRNESEAMEKKGGKRKYSRVKTMDKGNRKKRQTPMSLAKEIRKEGEKWQDAVKRASAMLKKK